MDALDELVAFVKQADNFTQDTRNWPDPTEPRAAQPPIPRGCTCLQGYKLDCPIHGLNADPEVHDLDHTWSMPEGSPVGYPQDQPRNWTQAVSSFVADPRSIMIDHGESESRPTVGKLSDVMGDLFASDPVRKHFAPIKEPGQDGLHGFGSGLKHDQAVLGKFGDHGFSIRSEISHVDSLASEVDAPDALGGGHKGNHQATPETHAPQHQSNVVIDEQKQDDAQPSNSITEAEVEPLIEPRRASLQPSPEPLHTEILAPTPRKLVIHRDEFGRMASIEEVYT